MGGQQRDHARPRFEGCRGVSAVSRAMDTHALELQGSQKQVVAQQAKPSQQQQNAEVLFEAGAPSRRLTSFTHSASSPLPSDKRGTALQAPEQQANTCRDTSSRQQLAAGARRAPHALVMVRCLLWRADGGLQRPPGSASFLCSLLPASPLPPRAPRACGACFQPPGSAAPQSHHLLTSPSPAAAHPAPPRPLLLPSSR